MNVQELTLTVNGAPMDYITFGSGKKNFVILAGMSLCSIRGLGEAIAEGFGIMTEDYTVYAFDHRRALPEGFTAQEISEDVAEALRQLGVQSADFMGFSLGGLVLQCLAMDHPALVRAAVLCSTACEPNSVSRENFTLWIDAARTGDVRLVNYVFYRRLWTEETYVQNEALLPSLLTAGTPEQCPGFAVQSAICLTFDRASELGKIRCPVLVLGSANDRVISVESMIELADRLGCERYIYSGFGHAVYDEAPDIKKRIYDFITR